MLTDTEGRLIVAVWMKILRVPRWHGAIRALAVAPHQCAREDAEGAIAEIVEIDEALPFGDRGGAVRQVSSAQAALRATFEGRRQKQRGPMVTGFAHLAQREVDELGGRGLVIPTGGLTSFQKRTVVGKKGWDKRCEVLVSPDLTGDAVPDLQDDG